MNHESRITKHVEQTRLDANHASLRARTCVSEARIATQTNGGVSKLGITLNVARNSGGYSRFTIRDCFCSNRESRRVLAVLTQLDIPTILDSRFSALTTFILVPSFPSPSSSRHHTRACLCCLFSHHHYLSSSSLFLTTHALHYRTPSNPSAAVRLILLCKLTSRIAIAHWPHTTRRLVAFNFDTVSAAAFHDHSPHLCRSQPCHCSPLFANATSLYTLSALILLCHTNDLIDIPYT